ncbi:hypothetical protein B0H10DRAFT_1954218 [Mycena sp. CBHHK59/15]|nr:hypothetical protein B0H10DRAFT_1954218 [Mycena sp. CBHHK59/15]
MTVPISLSKFSSNTFPPSERYPDTYGTCSVSHPGYRVQKRGLPHKHKTFALKNVPTSPASIDAFLSAKLPRNPGALHNTVKHQMMHTHNPTKTITDVVGHDTQDQFIVSDIPWLILKYDCHINVEFSMGVNLFQYLFKYFFKAVDKANWKIVKQSLELYTMDTTRTVTGRKPVDEIKDYKQG